MKTNGHKMRALAIPANTETDKWWRRCFHDAVKPFISDMNGSHQAHVTELFRVFRSGGVGLSTDNPGGHRLKNSKGEPVPYTGQSFILRCPEFALSAKGREAADEYEGRK